MVSADDRRIAGSARKIRTSGRGRMRRNSSHGRARTVRLPARITNRSRVRGCCSTANPHRIHGRISNAQGAIRARRVRARPRRLFLVQWRADDSRITACAIRSFGPSQARGLRMRCHRPHDRRIAGGSRHRCPRLRAEARRLRRYAADRRGRDPDDLRLSPLSSLLSPLLG